MVTLDRPQTTETGSHDAGTGVASQVVLLVGTNKGAFFFASDAARREWHRSGPHLGGWEVYGLLGDTRRPERPRVLAATSHTAYGATVRMSEDGGATWSQMLKSPRYAAGSGRTVKRIWHLAPGAPSEPDTCYAGVEDAGLFVSRDGGKTWIEVESLSRHPTRPHWVPGAGGLCLHSIVVDPANPRRMWVAVSAAGVLRTEDGGETWAERNAGLRTSSTGGSEAGLCVHKLIADPRRSETLYLQHHGGVYVSPDAGDSWWPIETGLPSTFGFPIAATRQGDLFVAPLVSDEERYMPEGKLQLYRSRDGGRSWQPSARGLPEYPNFVGVLRDALATDSLDPAGVYFGTTAGEVFYSSDSGDSWRALPGQFSRVTCIRAWVVSSQDGC